MIAPDSDWLEPPCAEHHLLRELSSGMSGLGGRPVRHPAWTDPVGDQAWADRSRVTPVRARPVFSVIPGGQAKAA